MKVKDGDVLGFRDALYESQCSTCGEKLSWEADFDADGTSYHAICCDRRYRLDPRTVTVSAEAE